MSWRVVIVTRIAPVLAGFDAVVRDVGHEPVALLCVRRRTAVSPSAAATS